MSSENVRFSGAAVPLDKLIACTKHSECIRCVQARCVFAEIGTGVREEWVCLPDVNGWSELRFTVNEETQDFCPTGPVPNPATTTTTTSSSSGTTVVTTTTTTTTNKPPRTTFTATTATLTLLPTTTHRSTVAPPTTTTEPPVIDGIGEGSTALVTVPAFIFALVSVMGLVGLILWCRPIKRSRRQARTSFSQRRQDERDATRSRFELRNREFRRISTMPLPCLDPSVASPPPLPPPMPQTPPQPRAAPIRALSVPPAPVLRPGTGMG